MKETLIVVSKDTVEKSLEIIPNRRMKQTDVSAMHRRCHGHGQVAMVTISEPSAPTSVGNGK